MAAQRKEKRPSYRRVRGETRSSMYGGLESSTKFTTCLTPRQILLTIMTGAFGLAGYHFGRLLSSMKLLCLPSVAMLRLFSQAGNPHRRLLKRRSVWPKVPCHGRHRAPRGTTKTIISSTSTIPVETRTKRQRMHPVLCTALLFLMSLYQRLVPSIAPDARRSLGSC